MRFHLTPLGHVSGSFAHLTKLHTEYVKKTNFSLMIRSSGCDFLTILVTPNTNICYSLMFES